MDHGPASLEAFDPAHPERAASELARLWETSTSERASERRRAEHVLRASSFRSVLLACLRAKAPRLVEKAAWVALHDPTLGKQAGAAVLSALRRSRRPQEREGLFRCLEAYVPHVAPVALARAMHDAMTRGGNGQFLAVTLLANAGTARHVAAAPMLRKLAARGGDAHMQTRDLAQDALRRIAPARAQARPSGSRVSRRSSQKPSKSSDERRSRTASTRRSPKRPHRP